MLRNKRLLKNKQTTNKNQPNNNKKPLYIVAGGFSFPVSAEMCGCCHRLGERPYWSWVGSSCHLLNREKQSLTWLWASQRSTGNSRSKSGFFGFHHKLNMSIMAPLFQCSYIRRKLPDLWLRSELKFLSYWKWSIQKVPFQECVHYLCRGNPGEICVRGGVAVCAHSVNLLVVKFQSEPILSS